MSQNISDDDDDADNPYSSPESDTQKPRRKKSSIERVKGKVMAPAIGLIVAGSLGLAMSIFSIVLALTTAPPPVDPNAPEFIKSFQEGSRGPVAAIVQMGFAVLNLVIILGGVQMMNFQSRVFAIIASIGAIVNFGSCCCLLGAPMGIWSLIILSGADVIRAFESAAKSR